MFGNTHFNLGKEIINKINLSLSENEQNAFLSGIVYADIGKFKFDNTIGIESDSYNFLEKMKSYTKTAEEKWFAYGINTHIIQDKETSKLLKNIFGDNNNNYLQYIERCGILEHYFLSKNNSFIFNKYLDRFNFEQISTALNIYNINIISEISKNKAYSVIMSILDKHYKSITKSILVLYEDLIIKTYSSFGLQLTKECLYEQAANIIVAFAVSASILNTCKEIDKLSDKIEIEFEKLVAACSSSLLTLI